MDLPRSEIEALASKMIDGSITASEQKRLDAWLDQQMAKNVVELDAAFANSAEQLRDRMLQRILERADAKGPHRPRLGMMRWVPYVAAAMLVAAIIGIWALEAVDDKQVAMTDAVSLLDSMDIPPGGSRAVLTLADGQTVNLSETHVGIVVGDEIAYLDGSSVFGKQKHTPTHSLVLTTPKGGTYQITLADGTRVWLNAASTLKYPSQFADDERVVELKGEAYFDVAKSPTRPFRVISKDQTVEVLGTQFNVTAYEDEHDVKTTLVEGAVRVVPGSAQQSPIMLSPGQQSSLADEKITIDDIDTSPYVAWKLDMFYFKQTPFVEMMRQIERWYDVEVEYSGRIPQETFSGRMSRNVSLMTVLDLLKVSEIHYQIKGEKLIIE